MLFEDFASRVRPTKIFSSASDYECHAGAMIVGVTLKGVYAKVRD